MSEMQMRNVTPRAWLVLAVGGAIAFVGLPFAALLLWSFAGSWFHPDVLPTTWSLAAWADALSPSSRTWSALSTSVSIGLVVAAVSMIVAVPAGLVLGRERFRGRRFVEIVILAPLVVPPFALAMGLTLELLLLARFGVPLYHTWAGVALGHAIFAAPYAVRIVQAGAEGLGTQAESAARSLGASPLRAFWHVTLPAVAPALVLASLSAFLVSLGAYLVTFMPGGSIVQTLPLALMTQLSSLSRPAAAVTSLLLVLPGLLYLVLAERWLRRRGARVEFPVG